MRRLAASAVLCAALSTCAPPASFATTEVGVASVYWEGTRLADGGRFYPDSIVCAHRAPLPLGTTLHITNLANGRQIDCPLRDRGPFVRGRIVDLSRGAARALGVSGLAHVRIDY